jgi:CheY-like chemotaxis protein
MTRILVIEDEEPIRANLERFLKLEGFVVTTAGDGRSGAAAARSLLPDLILCDLVMPGMDGYQVISELSGDPRTRHIPLIVVSASADERERAGSIARGARDHITKPFELKTILETIRRFLPN